MVDWQVFVYSLCAVAVGTLEHCGLVRLLKAALAKIFVECKAFEVIACVIGPFSCGFVRVRQGAVGKMGSVGV